MLDAWYGTRQVAGGISGQAQVWVNVLGNVSDGQSRIKALSYRLNGGQSVALGMGPDQRRLLERGDFNVEIASADLRPGDNQVEISATNAAGLSSRLVVTVIYTSPAGELSLPFTVHWADVRDAQSVLQIVDGKWRWDASGIRPLELGYDRLLAVGDIHWRSYQVTVPVTIHSVDRAGFTDRYAGNQASFSVDLHWIGHSEVPVQCQQPRCGWDPVGDFNKFYFREKGNDFLAMKVAEDEENFPTIHYDFHDGDTYIFKASVEVTPQGNYYRMKVWEPASEGEPAWQFERLAAFESGHAGNPDHGAVALVAHYLDATIGDILIEPLPEVR